MEASNPAGGALGRSGGVASIETAALAHREQPAASLLRGLYQVDLIAIRVLKIKPFYA